MDQSAISSHMIPAIARCAAIAMSVAQVGLAGAPTTESAHQVPAKRVAITFDDLPVVSRAFTTIADHERITTRLLSAITRHHVPAIGFVNEQKLYRDGALDDRAVGLLRQWTHAGLELGNHTYSHLDLHTVPLHTYLDDITRGDSVTSRVLSEVGRRPRYFRHPFLHTGRTLAARASVDSVLTSRGYRVAPVTIDNSDYVFAAAYDAALGRRDSVDARRIAAEYVAYMERVFAFYEAQSTTLEGRAIPQVLLVHASVLNADYFDALARMIERRGYAFVTLDDALADSVYRSADTYVGPAGITWLHRWALTRGLHGSVFAGEPEVPADIATAATRGLTSALGAEPSARESRAHFDNDRLQLRVPVIVQVDLRGSVTSERAGRMAGNMLGSVFSGALGTQDESVPTEQAVSAEQKAALAALVRDHVPDLPFSYGPEPNAGGSATSLCSRAPDCSR